MHRPLFSARVLALAVALVPATASLAGEGALLLKDAWVRAMPPGQAMTAAYLRVSNPGKEGVMVTGVTASVGMASLHETSVVDGRSSMRELDQLPVAAGGAVALEPGGMHIMIMGLERTPAEGDTVQLCLQTSAVAEASCVAAPVQRGPGGGHQHHHTKQSDGH